jgi:hypothetical protein
MPKTLGVSEMIHNFDTMKTAPTYEELLAENIAMKAEAETMKANAEAMKANEMSCNHPK